MLSPWERYLILLCGCCGCCKGGSFHIRSKKFINIVKLGHNKLYGTINIFLLLQPWRFLKQSSHLWHKHYQIFVLYSHKCVVTMIHEFDFIVIISYKFLNSILTYIYLTISGCQVLLIDCDFTIIINLVSSSRWLNYFKNTMQFKF